MRLSDKQAALASLHDNPDRGVHIMVSGPMRCGKTVACMELVWNHLWFREQPITACLIARTADQWLGIVWAEFQRIAAAHRVPIRRVEGVWEVPNIAGNVNTIRRAIAVDGPNRAASKIQGEDFGLVYIDEFPNMPPGLVDEAKGRMLAHPDAMLIGSMNPEGPNHWAKADYIDRIVAPGDPMTGMWFRFGLSDNPVLDPTAIEELAAGYSGAFYRRRILGEWAASEGTVFPIYEVGIPDEGDPVQTYEVALDFAMATVTHALLVASTLSGAQYVVDEWVHDGRTEGEMPLAQQAAEIVQWATGRGERSISAYAVPPDAVGLADRIKELGVGGKVVKAVDKVLWGIQVTNRFLEHGDLKVSGRCRQLLRELDSHMWDPLATARGEDRPDKASSNGAHGVDALRYWCATITAVRTGVGPDGSKHVVELW